MQIKDLSQTVTSKKLNENMGKTFGYKLKLENFSDCQLEDARNKLRTDMSQMEMSESYDNILENTQYQKTRSLLDVINQAILERAETAELAENASTERYVSDKAMIAAIRHRAEKMSVPEGWIKNALSRIKLGESDRRELAAELTLRYDLTESQASWMLLEGEEQKAENILATKDMVSKITNWIEDTAAMKADQLLELLDSIRAEQGSEVSGQFNQIASQALEGVYTALVAAREGLSQALGLVAGERGDTMGAKIGGMPGAESPVPGGDIGGALPPPGLEGEEELPVPGGEAGRLQRESVNYSRKLGLMLSSKKK